MQIDLSTYVCVTQTTYAYSAFYSALYVVDDVLLPFDTLPLYISMFYVIEMFIDIIIGMQVS